MQRQSTSTAQRNARALRREPTASERALWRALRGEQLGVKFRRQHPLGSYIADFACLAPKLIVELDGSQHADQHEYDAKRDAFFRSQGFAVLRFQTDAPFVNLEGVLVTITEQIEGLVARAPTPALPQRGRVEEHRSQE
jgi:very-short-patch-repair endonuclease